MRERLTRYFTTLAELLHGVKVTDRAAKSMPLADALVDAQFGP